MNRLTLIAVAALAATLGAAANAQTLPQQMNHHAAQQSRIAADAAHGRVSAASTGSLHERTALVERVEADALLADDTASLQQLGYAERDLDHAIHSAEHARHGPQHEASLDHMHARVASARNAEQQHWIATGVRHGTLGPEQAAQLERDQADIAALQATLEQRGHESVDEALQVQHLQDVQDWAIHSGGSHA